MSSCDGYVYGSAFAFVVLEVIVMNRKSIVGIALVAAASLSLACHKEAPAPPSIERPSILLRHARHDARGRSRPGSGGLTTPSFNALAARGRRFR